MWFSIISKPPYNVPKSCCAFCAKGIDPTPYHHKGLSLMIIDDNDPFLSSGLSTWCSFLSHRFWKTDSSDHNSHLYSMLVHPRWTNPLNCTSVFMNLPKVSQSNPWTLWLYQLLMDEGFDAIPCVGSEIMNSHSLNWSSSRFLGLLKYIIEKYTLHIFLFGTLFVLFGF